MLDQKFWAKYFKVYDILNIVIPYQELLSELERELDLNNDDVEITIIDENFFHTFKPSLYEVATSEEPMRNIAIPFKEIFGDKAEIITGAITSINPKTQRIKLKDLEISYDYVKELREKEKSNLPWIEFNPHNSPCTCLGRIF